jgi:hypothetical protein
MTKYTPQMKEAFRSIPTPVKGFVLDVVEYKAYLGLRLYTENVDRLKTSDKVSVAEYLYLVRDTFKDMGAKVQFERVDGAPPNLGN